LEIVSTDYRPAMAELIFPKIKGPKENLTIDVEDIAIKGFKALGNQLTTDKLISKTC
jgi:topoisomerase-4 subunit A